MTLNKILSTHPWSFKKNAHMDYVRMPDRIYGRPSLFLNWTNNFLNVLSNLGEPPSSRICQTHQSLVLHLLQYFSLFLIFFLDKALLCCCGCCQLTVVEVDHTLTCSCCCSGGNILTAYLGLLNIFLN